MAPRASWRPRDSARWVRSSPSAHPPAPITSASSSTTPEGGGPTVTLRLGGRRFEVARSFLEDLSTHDLSTAVAELGRPLLVVHAVSDEVVDVGEGERLFAAARQPKGFHPLEGADHLLTDRGAAEHALQVVRAWFDATL